MGKSHTEAHGDPVPTDVLCRLPDLPDEGTCVRGRRNTRLLTRGWICRRACTVDAVRGRSGRRYVVELSVIFIEGKEENGFAPDLGAQRSMRVKHTRGKLGALQGARGRRVLGLEPGWEHPGDLGQAAGFVRLASADRATSGSSPFSYSAEPGRASRKFAKARPPCMAPVQLSFGF